MSRAYLSGPMANIEQNNFPLFIKLAALLRKMGWEVISPVDLNIAAGVTPEKNTYEAFTEEERISLVRGDVEAILSLRPSHGDCVIVMDDWFTRGAKSRGVFAELALADWLGLPVYRLSGDSVLNVSVRRLVRQPYTNVWHEEE